MNQDNDTEWNKDQQLDSDVSSIDFEQEQRLLYSVS